MAPGAAFFVSYICDVGLRYADIATGDPVCNTGEEKQPKCFSESKHQERDQRSEQTDDQNWTAPKSIRESS